MARQWYKDFAFRGSSLNMIKTMNTIVAEYMAQGFKLTVRQLYYQLVARGIIPNTERSYHATTLLVNNARLAGFIDWDAIEDRTRAFIRRSRWQSGSQILGAVAGQFHMDMWEGQSHRVFVIVEKEALAGVLEGVCHDYDMPLLAARGYPSASVLREFAVDQIMPAQSNNQTPVILHLGDHDPSGIDMSRDLQSRMDLFSETGNIEFVRIALNMDQIAEQNPPPNPAKTTDSRFESYKEEYGDESWELDALKPDYLAKLVREHVDKYIEFAAWISQTKKIEKTRKRLAATAKEFDT